MSLSMLIAELQHQCQNQPNDFNLCRRKNQCIHQAPFHIKSLDSDAYKPRAFTFGPAFFRSNVDDSSYDQSHKYRALGVFLGEEQQLRWQQLLLEPLRSIWRQVEDAYDPPLLSNVDRKSGELMIIMLLDAAFMIELMSAAAAASAAGGAGAILHGYSENDPIFSRHGFSRAFPTMKRDMLLLENQLPLLVLNELLGVKTGKYDNEDFINNLILNFYDIKGPPPSGLVGCHVLDVVHKCLLLGRHPDQGRMPTRPMTTPVAIVLPAMELQKAGVRFVPRETRRLDDMTFKSLKLYLPVLEVHHHTESMFLNLMAYERLNGKTGEDCVCSYIAFMSRLIVSARDVYVLRLEGIVKNGVGCEDDAVVRMLRSLSRGVEISIDSRLRVLCREINSLCEERGENILSKKVFRKGWNMF